MKPHNCDATGVEPAQLALSVGESAARLTDLIAHQADSRGLRLFLVGGVVRDLLLGLPAGDLDFTLESDALAFAQRLQRQYGGGIHAHKPFGTAKWTPDDKTAQLLNLPPGHLPGQIDFVRARSENYPSPAALPRVHAGNILQDMQRRDFSVNALALQLSPRIDAWRLLDCCGGMDDLDKRQIRALHADSFLDDPTRILRAQRFAARLDFDIETQTDIWMQAALPMLALVSGARLRNEIDLALEESEPATALTRMQRSGALSQILPTFRLPTQLTNALQLTQTADLPWQSEESDLRWSLLLADCKEDDARRIAKRLHFTRAQTEAATATCRILSKRDRLADPSRKPSELVPLLDSAPQTSLHAAWILLQESPVARQRLNMYTLEWQHKRQVTSGQDLLALGLPPGPVYKRLLGQLRQAWLDGDIASPDAEQALLDKLLASLP